MNDPLESIEYRTVHGKQPDSPITVYALSTCAFCKRGMQYLEGNDVAYRYVYLDQLEFDTKRSIKEELRRRYGNLPVFPVITVGDTRAISGFRKEQWAAELGLPQEGAEDQDER